MSFGIDIRVVPSNIAVRQGPRSPGREEEIWKCGPPVRSDAVYRQITLAIVIIMSIDCTALSE